MANINQILGFIDYIQGKKQQGRQAESRKSLSDFISESGGITGTVPGEETTPVTLPGAQPQRVGTTFGGKDIGFQTGGIPESTINVPEQIPVTQSPEFQKRYLDVASQLQGPSFLNAIGSLGGITQPDVGASEPYGYKQRRSLQSGEITQVPVAPEKFTPFQDWRRRNPNSPVKDYLELQEGAKRKGGTTPAAISTMKYLVSSGVAKDNKEAFELYKQATSMSRKEFATKMKLKLEGGFLEATEKDTRFNEIMGWYDQNFSQGKKDLTDPAGLR